MKKIILVLLVLVMVLTMAACGKEPTVTGILEYPIGSKSLSECEKFIKGCGFEVKSAANDMITFQGGAWDGYASLGSVPGVTLNYNQFHAEGVSFEDAVASAHQELKAVCGEPYATNTNSQLKMTTEFYSYSGKVIGVTITTGPMESLNIAILPAPSN